MIWIKGVGLGIAMFGAGLVVYMTAMLRFLAKGQPALPPGTTVGFDFITFFQHSRVSFFLALAATIILGIVIVSNWPTRIPS
jgi:hypothetical protein